MKNAFLFFAFVTMTSGIFAQTVELKTNADSANYAYGVILGNAAKKQLSANFRPDLFLAAVKTVFDGGQVLFTEDASNKIYGEYNRREQAKINEKWKAENQAFLDKNKARKEVTTTASGLQYEVLTKGTGTVSPVATDKVEVHYHGTLIDGTIFDSSVQRNQTSTFGLNQVIKGWTEGLQYMKIGDKFRFYIPYNLAYGEQGRPKIKPFSTLIFDVELFKVNP
jgi:FKBP-type peptidyl-prolyl cis-trans isomerase FklB